MVLKNKDLDSEFDKQILKNLRLKTDKTLSRIDNSSFNVGMADGDTVQFRKVLT